MNSNRDKLFVWLWFYFYCFGVCSRLGNLEIWSKHNLQRPGHIFLSLFLVTQKELPIFKSQHFSWWYPMKTTICFMVNHPNSVESATKTIPANSKKNRWITTRGWVTLWLFNSSPWKIPMLFLERYGPSISIRAIENPWLALWMSCHNQLGYSPGIHQLKQLPSGKQSQKTKENHDVSWVNPLEIYGHNINSQLLVITRG